MPRIPTIAIASAFLSLVLAGCVGGNQYQGGNYGLQQQDATKHGETGGLSNEGGSNEGSGSGGR